MSQKKLDNATEIQVVAKIARGDTYEAIRADLEAQGISITISTISAVRKRNMQSLEFMKNELQKHELSISAKLLTKSRHLLERKLNRALKQDEEMEKLRQDYKDGEIDGVQFKHLFDKSLKAELTIAELTTLAKEMFNQSQVEQGKPTSISENPAQAKENLKTLLQAINNKDDTKILEAIFPDA